MAFTIYLPLTAILFYRYTNHLWWKYFLVFSIIGCVLIVLGGSRTELVMFLILVLTILTFHYRKLLWILLSPLAFIVVIILFSYIIPTQNAIYKGNLMDFMHKVSSNRILIWEHAITNPPDNLLLGTGINNTDASLPAYDLSDALHNAFLEIWYETGFLGLALWLGLFTLLLKDVYKVYLAKDSDFRFLYMIFLSCFVAIIVAGLLDKGYMSMHYRWRIYVFGALLFVIGRHITASQITEKPIRNSVHN